MPQHEATIWNFLVNKLGNEYGAAGMMGNLEAESGLYPNNLQNKYNESLGYTDNGYTQAVNNGSYSRSQFVNDRAGYGLAQWTHSSRKAGLYDAFKSGGYSSIDNIDLQLNYLWSELNSSFKGVLSVLKNADSIREASDKVLEDFENPYDQSTSVHNYRVSLCQKWYDKYATGGDSGGGDSGGGDSGGGDSGGGNEGGGGYEEPNTNIIPPELCPYQHSYPYIGESDAEAKAYKAVEWIVNRYNLATAVYNSYDHANHLSYGVGEFGYNAYDGGTFVIQAFSETGFPVKEKGALSRETLIEAFRRSGFELMKLRFDKVRQGDVVLGITSEVVPTENKRLYNFAIVVTNSSYEYSGSLFFSFTTLGYYVGTDISSYQNHVQVSTWIHEEVNYGNRYTHVLRYKNPTYDDTLKDRKLSKLLLYACGSDII